MTNEWSDQLQLLFVSPLLIQGSNLSQRIGKTGLLLLSNQWVLNGHRRFLCLDCLGL